MSGWSGRSPGRAQPHEARIEDGRGPQGPRGRTGATAEDVAARHLLARGWTILGRNVRVGRDELDVVGLEPGMPPTLVVVEVRSSSGGGFGAPEESVDATKVKRLYRAAGQLVREGRLPDGEGLARGPWRVDLVTVVREDGAVRWRVRRHLRGLLPP